MINWIYNNENIIINVNEIEMISLYKRNSDGFDIVVKTKTKNSYILNSYKTEGEAKNCMKRIIEQFSEKI